MEWPVFRRLRPPARTNIHRQPIPAPPWYPWAAETWPVTVTVEGGGQREMRDWSSSASGLSNERAPVLLLDRGPYDALRRCPGLLFESCRSHILGGDVSDDGRRSVPEQGSDGTHVGPCQICGQGVSEYPDRAACDTGGALPQNPRDSIRGERPAPSVDQFPECRLLRRRGIFFAYGR